MNRDFDESSGSGSGSGPIGRTGRTGPTSLSKGVVASINISVERGAAKRPVEGAVLTERGIEGDAHAGPWHRQVSLLGMESIERFSAEVGRELGPGLFAENITTRGLDLRQLAMLDRLTIGEAELEVTQLGKACHADGCAVFAQVGKCVMPKEGIFCRVVREGKIRQGDEVLHVARPLGFRVLTLSDRASRGEYRDLSGPRVEALLRDFFGPTRWRLNVERAVVPDDASQLRRELQMALESGVDVIITTGGTGVGERDITPDVASPLCDKLIPGIMEHIRVKYGASKPNALLSRSIAGTIGQSLIYTLPGSVRAVEDYMLEILKTMEHLLLMLRGIDPHRESPD